MRRSCDRNRRPPAQNLSITSFFVTRRKRGAGVRGARGTSIRIRVARRRHHIYVPSRGRRMESRGRGPPPWFADLTRAPDTLRAVLLDTGAGVGPRLRSFAVARGEDTGSPPRESQRAAPLARLRVVRRRVDGRRDCQRLDHPRMHRSGPASSAAGLAPGRVRPRQTPRPISASRPRFRGPSLLALLLPRLSNSGFLSRSPPRSFTAREFQAAAPWQRLNHVPGASAVTRKDSLVRRSRLDGVEEGCVREPDHWP